MNAWHGCSTAISMYTSMQLCSDTAPVSPPPEPTCFWLCSHFQGATHDVTLRQTSLHVHHNVGSGAWSILDLRDATQWRILSRFCMYMCHDIVNKRAFASVSTST